MNRIRSTLWGGMALGLLICWPNASKAQLPAPIQGIPSAPVIASAMPVPIQQVMVPLGAQVRFQMGSKREIAQVFNPKNSALVISARPELRDASTVFLTGLAPDMVRVEFVDVNGQKELYDFVIQLDVEYIKLQLRKAVQAGNLQVAATGANTVLVTGTVSQPQDVDLINRVVQSIGNLQVINGVRVGGVQQVQLDVVVAQVSRREFRRMSFDFLTNSSNFFLGNTVGQAAITPSLIGTGGSLSTGPSLSGATGSPGGANTNVVFGVLYNNWGVLNFLQALRDEGLVKTLAEPRLVTLSGRPASFLAGGEQAIPVPAGLGQVGVQFSEFGTRLNFLPIVLGNGKIHLEVQPEVSNLDPNFGTTINGTTVPGRSTSRVNTTVQLEPGQTFVIGGLIQHQVIGTARKVPFLGDFPLLNLVFSTKGFDEEEQELIVLVTPHLVDAQDCQQTEKTVPGQESRSPDDFELFLEGILEAPRGPRKVWNGYKYIPAYQNGPGAKRMPFSGDNSQSGGSVTRVGVVSSPVTGPVGSSMVPAGTMPAVLPTYSPPAIGQPSTLPVPSVPGQPQQGMPGVQGVPSQVIRGPDTNRLPNGPPVRSSPPPSLPPGIE